MVYNLHFLGFVIDKEKVIDIRDGQYIYEILGYCIYDSNSNKKKYITKNGMKDFIAAKISFRYSNSSFASPYDLKVFDISHVVRYNYIKIRNFSYERGVIVTEGIEIVDYDTDSLLSIGINLRVSRYSCCIFDIKGGLLLEGIKTKNHCSNLFGITVDLNGIEMSFSMLYSFTNNRCEIHDIDGDYVLLNSEANLDWYTLYDMKDFKELLQDLGFYKAIKLDSSDKLTVFELDDITVYEVLDADIVIGNGVKNAKVFKHTQIPYTDTTIVLGRDLQKLDLYNMHGNLRIAASRGRHYSLLCEVLRELYYTNSRTIPAERLLDYYDRGGFTQASSVNLSIVYYSLD